MKNLLFKTAVGLTFVGSPIALLAQNTAPLNVVTSAVPFLRISPDARAGGMGDVGIATIPDANSVHWNQAKLPFAESRTSIAMTYTPWLKDLGLNDVFLAYLAGYHQIDELQTVSASMRYFNLGNIQFTDAFGQDLQLVRPREFSIDAGYTRKLSDKHSLGVALRYINSNLAGSNTVNGQTYKPGNSVAADISYFFNNLDENGQGITAGAVMSNLGSKIAYTSNADDKDYIPANLGLGAAYTRVFDDMNKITFGLDVNKLMVPTPPLDENGNFPSEEALRAYRSKGVVGSWFSSFGDAPGGFSEELREFQISIGTEYWYNNQFAVRAGYFYEDKTKGNRKFFSVGAGLKYNVFGLNFSYLVPSGTGTNRNPLSNTLRFSLIFDIGGNNYEY